MADVVQRSYETCKSHAVSKYETHKNDKPELLKQIKMKYEDVVNSPRTYELINDLQTLLKVLEKRGSLSPNNIDALEHIYGILNINTKMLEHHKTSIVGDPTYVTRGEDDENRAPPRTPRNPSFHYTRHNVPENIPLESADFNRQRLSERGVCQFQINDIMNRPSILNEQEIQGDLQEPDGFGLAVKLLLYEIGRVRLCICLEHALPFCKQWIRVINVIITRVGSSWQELARYLKVQECKIHGISQDSRLRSYEDKMRAVLKIYEKDILPEELKIKLLKALRLAGRMDIHDDVQKLFLREI